MLFIAFFADFSVVGQMLQGPMAPPFEHTLRFYRINFKFLLRGELLFTLGHPYVTHNWPAEYHTA